MKKFYFLIFLITFGIAPIVNAQQTLFSEDFESGYTHDTELVGVNGWQNWGTNQVDKSVNDDGEGANGSNWYAEDTGGNFAVLAQNYSVVSGEEYTFKAKVFQTGSGAIKLQANSATIESNIVNTGLAGSWQDLTVTFTSIEDANYSFRIIHIWGAATFKIDNVEITCTSCATASIDKNNSFEFNTYPNPVKDVFRIQSKETLVSAKVYDMLGRKVKEQKSNVEIIDMSNLNKGIYMLKVEAENGGLSTKRVIKQ